MKRKLVNTTLALLLIMQSFFSLAPTTFAEEDRNDYGEQEVFVNEGDSEIEEVNNEENPQESLGTGNMSLMSGSYLDMDNPADHIQSAVFKVNNVQVTDFTDVKVKNDDTASFRYELKDLPAEHRYGPGSKLTIELPAGIFNVNDLKAGAKTNIGDVSFSGSDVIFTLNENILDAFGTPAAAKEIFFEFSATFNKTEGGLSENITIPGFEEIILNFTPKKGTPIVKQNGTPKPQKQNAEYIEWEAIVNTDFGATGSVNFVDKLTGGHTFKEGDTVTLTELTLGPNGGPEPSDYTEVSTETKTINADHLSESNTKLTLSLDGTKAYKITYNTYPDDPKNNISVTYYNNANYNDESSGQKSAEITYDPPLEKKVTSSPSGSNLETNWEIKVNHNKRSLTGITVTDTWTTNGGSGKQQQEIVGDVEIYDASDNKLTDHNFNIVHNQDGQGFSVEFGNINDAYTIKYKTKPTDGTYITSDMTVNNTVTRSDDVNTFKSSGSVTYYQTSHMLQKTSPAINYAVKEIEWKIVANGAKYNLAGDSTNPITFEDRFSTDKGKLTLQENSLVVKVGTLTLTNGTDYTLEVLENNQGFNIKIPNNVTDKVEITYTTDYDIAGFGTNENVYKNTMTLNSNTLTVSPTHSAQRTSDEKPEQKANGKKTGVYNYADKKFEWEVLLNFNYHAFNNAIFEDVITGELEQTIANVKIYSGQLDANGNFTNSVEVTNANDITTEPNKLTIELGAINQPYKITYESYVKNEVIPETFGKLEVTNTATLKELGATTPNATWNKKVGVNYTDKLVKKTGTQLGNTAGIKWNFEFNYAQSNLSNIVITDDVGRDADGNPNQLIKEDSFKVYKVNLSGKSDSKTGGTATKETTEFTNYELDVDVKNGTFELKINENGRNAYYVEYETVYLGESGKTVKNDVEVSYQSDDGTEASDSYSFASFTYDSGGKVIKVPFVVIKTDAATGEVMSGIDFTLYHKASGNKLISGTTDSNGIFDLGFAISEATYYLTEDNVPTGYKNPGQIEFKLHRDSKETSGTYTGKQVVLVENIPEAGLGCEEFTLTVKDVDRKAVANKNVKLTNKATGQTITVTTGTDGEVNLTRDEVKAGTYTVTVDENDDTLGDVYVTYGNECSSYVLQPEPKEECSNFTVEIQDENSVRTDLREVTLKHNGTKNNFTVTNGQFTVPYDMVKNGKMEAGVTYSVYENKQFLTTVEISYKNSCDVVVKKQAPMCEVFTLIVRDVDGEPRKSGVDVVVKVKDTETVVATGVTDENGKVTLSNLEPGEYEVYERGTNTLIAEFASNTDCTASIQPAPKCENFTVSIINIDGNQLKENTPIRLVGNEPKTVGVERMAMTNEDGNVLYKSKDLPAGEYKVYRGDVLLGEINVSYKENCNITLDLTQKAPICESCRINILNSSGQARTGIDITIQDSDGNLIMSKDKDGNLIQAKDEEGNLIEDEEGNPIFVTTFTTDENGQVLFDNSEIKAGITYTVYLNGITRLGTFIIEDDCVVTIRPTFSGGGGGAGGAPPSPEEEKDPEEKPDEDEEKNVITEIIKDKEVPTKIIIIDEEGNPKEVPEDFDIFNPETPGIHEFIVIYEDENGNEVIVGIIKITVGEDGIVTEEELIDPYGMITMCVSYDILGDVEVELYYADTPRNRAAGKTPGTLVELPRLEKFGPNFNANPQVSKYDPEWSDIAGDYATYAWMVFPKTDYYIVAKRAGFQDEISDTISVEYDIVKYDFCMIPSEPIEEDNGEKDPSDKDESLDDSDENNDYSEENDPSHSQSGGTNGKGDGGQSLTQTGEERNMYLIFGGILSIILGLSLIFFRRKKMIVE